MSKRESLPARKREIVGRILYICHILNLHRFLSSSRYSRAIWKTEESLRLCSVRVTRFHLATLNVYQAQRQREKERTARRVGVYSSRHRAPCRPEYRSWNEVVGPIPFANPCSGNNPFPVGGSKVWRPWLERERELAWIRERERQKERTGRQDGDNGGRERARVMDFASPRENVDE